MGCQVAVYLLLGFKEGDLNSEFLGTQKFVFPIEKGFVN